MISDGDRDPAREGAVVQLAAWVTRAFLLVGIILDIVLAALPALPSVPVKVLSLFVLFHYLVRLATMVSFLTWLAIRYASLPRAGWYAPAHTPAGAVGWFFVPLVNLVRPHRIVQEMWEATEPDGSSESSQSLLVLAWWVTFIAAPVCAVGFGVALVTPESLHGSAKALLLISFFNVVAAALASRVVAQIDKRWRAKVAGAPSGDDGWEIIEPEPLESETPPVIPVAEPQAAPPPPAPVFAPPPLPPPVSLVEPPPPPPPVLPASPSPVSPPPPPIPAARAASAPLPPPSASEVRLPERSAPPAEVRLPHRVAPPAEDDPVVLAELRELLGGAQRAARLLAIVGAVSISVMLCGILFFLSRSLPQHPVATHIMLTISLVYLGFGMLYLVPIVHQWRFSTAAERFITSGAPGHLEAALRLQGRFWAFVGGALALVIVVEFFAIGTAIVIPLILRLL